MAYDKVPCSLSERGQWVNWRRVKRDGYEIKLPCMPSGEPAKTDNPSTWSTFDEVVKAAPRFAGIGYVFSEADDFTGIDLDASRDPETGKIQDWALVWVKKMSSYTEVSPSGTGVKIWVRGVLPFKDGKNVKLPNYPTINGKTAGCEAYSKKRYFCVTGQRLSGLSEECENRQTELEEFYDHFFKVDSPVKKESGLIVSSQSSVIERARKYLATMDGAISGQAGHNQTFKAACVLVQGFALSQPEAFVLLTEWNSKCQPPWGDKDLKHKIESADKQEGDRPRGYLIKVDDIGWKDYQLPVYDEKAPQKPHLVVDNTKYKLSEEELERIAIMEEASSDGHAFMQSAEGLFRLSIPEYGVIMELDRLRRESNELIGELVVKCAMKGVRSYDGALSVGDLNVSSVRARMDRAKMLNTRTNFGSKEDWIDWIGYLEEFCQRVILDERKGNEAVDLRSLEVRDNSSVISLPGMVIPARHQTIIFGDGGAAKSYTALYFAGLMAKMGIKVALFDWELAGEDHRERLEMLFPDGMPEITYARCERGITSEVDRLRRIVKDNAIEYVFYDSIAFACGGRPEEAEIAGSYFRSVRQIGGGSLHIAHISKAEGADQKPFGSTFWANGARATWYVKSTPDQTNDSVIHLGFFNRKANLAKIQRLAGFRVEFTEWQTIFTTENAADFPELAEKMTLTQRMRELLKKGPMTTEEIASSTGAPLKRINESAKRNTKLFVVEGGKVANLYRG